MMRSVTQMIILTAAICSIAAGCKSVRHMTGVGTTTAKVKVTANGTDQNVAVEKAANIIRSKADALHLDVNVVRPDNANDVLVVTFYDGKPSDAVTEILLKAHRLELKKAVENGRPPKVFESQDAAKQTLKAGEEALPIKDIRETATQTFLAVETQPVITGEDIRSAKVFEVSGMDPSVIVDLKPDAAAKFKDWTSRNWENYLAIVLDGQVLSYPIIKGEMSDSAMIQGNFTKEQAADLALDLNAGYLEGTMTILDGK